jgi:tetratricopeptide (TPR) repeat protein
VKIIEMREGPDHPGVALLLGDMAEGYRAEGRLDKAEPAYRRALAIWERSAGWNHPLVVTTLGGLAQVRQARGDAAEAEKLLTQAIGIVEASPLGTTPAVRAQQAELLTALAGLYRAQGRPAEADAAQARARSLTGAP